LDNKGSETRFRSDLVLSNIVTPAAAEAGYTVTRADKIPNPGLITTQVIQHILEDELVVADLTYRNPNVYYELAVRHATRKPVVQLIEQGEPLPFDVQQIRTIRIDHRDFDSHDKYKADLKSQIAAAERNPNDADNPISEAFKLAALRQSDDLTQQSLAEILSLLKASNPPATSFWPTGDTIFSHPSSALRRGMLGSSGRSQAWGILEQLNAMLNTLEILVGNIAVTEDQNSRKGALQDAMNFIEKMRKTIRRGLAERKEQEEAYLGSEAFTDEYLGR